MSHTLAEHSHNSAKHYEISGLKETYITHTLSNYAHSVVSNYVSNYVGGDVGGDVGGGVSGHVGGDVGGSVIAVEWKTIFT